MPRRNRREVRQPRTFDRPHTYSSEADRLEAMARGLVDRGLASTNILDRPNRYTPPLAQRETTA
jgi:hypothetical protein